MSKKRTTRDKSERVKTAKGRTTSSTQWLKRQLNDPYVAKAQMDGYRGRAAYKLIPRAPKAEEEASLSAIVGRAMQDSNYILIFLGFFSCGYQLGFMTAHFPAFQSGHLANCLFCTNP